MHANLHGSLAAYGVDAFASVDNLTWLRRRGLKKRHENPHASRISVFASPETYEASDTKSVVCI